jgi:hypothetical protein
MYTLRKFIGNSSATVIMWAQRRHVGNRRGYRENPALRTEDREQIHDGYSLVFRAIKRRKP